MEDNIRIIEVKRSIFADNDADAERLRQELKEKKVFLLNLMSSPGSGKTTTLLALAKALEGRIKMGVMEADICLLYTSCLRPLRQIPSLHCSWSAGLTGSYTE